MSKVKLASTLPWRELMEQRAQYKMNLVIAESQRKNRIQKVGWNPTNNYYRQKNKRTKYLDDKYVFLLETLRASSHVPSNQTYLYFTK